MNPALPLALYIHWPFCKAKCPYCDFNSHVRDHVAFNSWQSALLSELEYMHRLVPKHRLQSIFFGGGTPSLMPPSIAELLINRARELWAWDEPVEITLEANPTSVEADTFPAFKAAGVNRLSIGVQSLRPDALAFLGREHSVGEAMRAIELARKYFERYSFDLIYARPGQTLGEWQEELAEALDMTGDHLSLYQLTIEENTAFYTAYQKGEFEMPESGLAADMYELTEQMTGGYGLASYEVSNYAKPGFESRHNLAYWKGYDYVGVGPGAHGRIPDYVFADAHMAHGSSPSRHTTLTLKSPERWLEAVQKQGHGVETIEPLPLLAQAEERLMMGLRLREGIIVEDWLRPFISEQKWQLAIKEGLLEASTEKLVATAKGRLILTTLTAQLLRSY